jgi:hypothetical protein
MRCVLLSPCDTFGATMDAIRTALTASSRQGSPAAFLGSGMAVGVPLTIGASDKAGIDITRRATGLHI